MQTGYKANLWLRAAVRYTRCNLLKLCSTFVFSAKPRGTPIWRQQSHTKDAHTAYSQPLYATFCCCRVLVHVAEGDLSGQQRGGDALYSFFRAAADWPGLLAEGQTFAVEVQRCLQQPLAGLQLPGTTALFAPSPCSSWLHEPPAWCIPLPQTCWTSFMWPELQGTVPSQVAIMEDRVFSDECMCVLGRATGQGEGLQRHPQRAAGADAGQGRHLRRHQGLWVRPALYFCRPVPTVLLLAACLVGPVRASKRFSRGIAHLHFLCMLAFMQGRVSQSK